MTDTQQHPCGQMHAGKGASPAQAWGFFFGTPLPREARFGRGDPVEGSGDQAILERNDHRRTPMTASNPPASAAAKTIMMLLELMSEPVTTGPSAGS